jgi:hypothetical protein
MEAKKYQIVFFCCKKAIPPLVAYDYPLSRENSNKKSSFWFKCILLLHRKFPLPLPYSSVLVSTMEQLNKKILVKRV